MSTLWPYFWPALSAGAVAGIIAGLIGFRSRHKLRPALAIGALATIALAALWHGPFGAADRFSRQVEGDVRLTLINNEIPEVTGHLHHGPLTRQVLLSGPADDFQRSELVRIMPLVPGVASATWSAGTRKVPLLAEGIAAAIAGFLLGLLVAYLVERRRLYNAQWNW